MGKRCKTNPEVLRHTDTIAELPRACSDELAAVEFIEKQRWGGTPACPHCEQANVYQMRDATTGERSKRFLWRCHSCKKQFTVRVGTVFEDSRIPLRHWCYAFWRAATSKKGVSALEIKRQTGLSYKSALFLLHRIRYGMAPDHAAAPKLEGTVEVDETYIGGKPRYRKASNRGKYRDWKPPVVALVQRGGDVRCRPVADVSAYELKGAIRELVDSQARIMTDENPCYCRIGREFAGGHHTVRHKDNEYVRGDVTTNTVEGFFSLIKRGVYGTYHKISRERLPLYLSEFEFRYNRREMNDGDRVVAAIRAAEGKRLMYREPLGR